MLKIVKPDTAIVIIDGKDLKVVDNNVIWLKCEPCNTIIDDVATKDIDVPVLKELEILS